MEGVYMPQAGSLPCLYLFVFTFSSGRPRGMPHEEDCACLWRLPFTVISYQSTVNNKHSEEINKKYT